MRSIITCKNNLTLKIKTYIIYISTCCWVYAHKTHRDECFMVGKKSNFYPPNIQTLWQTLESQMNSFFTAKIMRKNSKINHTLHTRTQEIHGLTKYAYVYGRGSKFHYQWEKDYTHTLKLTWSLCFSTKNNHCQPLGRRICLYLLVDISKTPFPWPFELFLQLVLFCILLYVTNSLYTWVGQVCNRKTIMGHMY